MVLIPDDILFSIAQYGGEPPVDPKRLVEEIMEVYPIFSFKREYHLRLLQHEVKNMELYPVYIYIKDTFPNFFKFLDGNYTIPINIDPFGHGLDERFKIEKFRDSYFLEMKKELKIELFTIHSIFNPLITSSSNPISTKTYALKEHTLCSSLFNILALYDDSLNESYEFYIKIIEFITDEFNLAEVYRQCLMKSRELEYIHDDSVTLFYDIVNTEDVTIRKHYKYMRVIGTEISNIRLLLIEAGFNVSTIIKYNLRYIGEFGVIKDPQNTFTVHVSQDFMKNYFRLEAAKNPYIRRCYYSDTRS